MTTQKRRVPARVLGCLSRTHITVILYPNVGLADGGINIDVPIEDVPLDCRMPNSEFDMIFDSQDHTYLRIIRRGEMNDLTGQAPRYRKDRILGLRL